MSKYVILERDMISNLWREVGESDAAGQHSAIKEQAGEREGTFVAVPERSWHPVKVQRVEAIRWSLVDGSGELTSEEFDEEQEEAEAK